MATDLERLVVSLSADVKSYERALAKAQGTTNTRARAIENRWRKTNSVISSQLGRLGGILLGGVALRGAQELIDASTRIDNALKVAGLSGAELTRVYDALFISAQKNAAPLESLVTLYGRASLVQNELKVSTEELLRFTDNVAVALRVAGTDAQSASGALLQLSQALGSGVVRAEEFNSILEGALPIAQAAAAGLKEAGGSVAQLRTLVIDGKISSEAFFRAFEAGAEILRAKVAGSTLTVGQAFVTLRNSLIDTAGKFENATGIAAGLTREVLWLADAIAILGGRFEDLPGPLQKVGDFIGLLRNKMTELREATGIESFFRGTSLLEGRIGFADKPDPAAEALEERAAAIDKLREAMSRSAATVFAEAKQIAAMNERFDDAFGTRPVSLADFAAPGGKAGGGAGSKEGDLQRETKQLQEKIRAMQVEVTLIGQTAFARDRANATLELENAARKEGITLTDAQRGKIEQLADAYAVAAENVRAAETSFESMVALQEEFGNLAIDGIFDLIDGTRSLNDVLGDTLKVLAKMALQSALLGQGPLASLFGTASTTGGVGGILGALFGGGRASGGPISPGKVYKVHKDELIVPRVPGTVIPASKAAGGGAITYAPTIDARGSDMGEARFRQILADSEASFKQSIVPIVRDAQSRRALR